MRNRFLLPSLFVLLAGAAVVAQTLPELPRVYIDTTYAPPSGNTLTVNAGGNLQAALNNAQLGDTIILQAGATFTGNFSLPNKTSGSGWIYVMSGSYANLPAPGRRVRLADAAYMPKIVAPYGSAINTAASSHHYRFVGIEFKPTAGTFLYNVITIGNGDTSTATLPHDIVFDRCYIHGDPAAGSRRGVAMNGTAVAVIDSYVSDFKEIGADTQALWAHNTPGPLKVANNYLEAAGENLMFGGSPPSIANVNPSDIEVRWNLFFKPLSWMGSSWSVKNLLEFKSGQRVLVEGNRFENNWPHSQNGFSVLITPRTEGGTSPWLVTQDITIRLNLMKNLAQGFNMSGRDGADPALRTHRILIQNNVIEVSGLGGSDGRIYQVLAGVTDLTIDHNTAFSSGPFGMMDGSPKNDRFDFKNNLVTRGSYGFFGSGVGEGNACLAAYYTNWQFTKNAIIGGAASSYPPGCFFPATIGDVGFVDYAGGNYRLGASSPYRNLGTDGKDLGMDLDALQAALGGGGNQPPVLDSGPTASPNPALVSETVLFSAAASDADGDPLSYVWAFGDGSTSAPQAGGTASHAFSAAGTYTATVTASDGKGGMVSGKVTVNVKQPGYLLTTGTTGTGSGVVALNPTGGAYPPGAVVTLTATADAGSLFFGWGGDLSGSTNPTTIVMDANRTVTAKFDKVTYTVTATAGTGGTITPNGAVTVSQGAPQTFTIAPHSGYVIAGVDVDGAPVGAVNSYTFNNVMANHTIAATFSPVAQPALHVSRIDLSVYAAGRNFVAKGKVFVVDQTGALVSGATVAVNWSGAVRRGATAVTGSAGIASFTSGKAKSKGPFTLTVLGITAPGYAYDPARNVVTSRTATFGVASPGDAAGAPGPAVEAGALTVTRALVKVNFGKTGADRLYLAGDLEVPAGWSPAERTFSLDFGGVRRTFTLNANGLGRDGENRCRLQIKDGAEGLAVLLIRLKGDWGGALADEGLGNETVKGKAVCVTVTAGQDGVASADLNLRYSAKAGGIGVAH